MNLLPRSGRARIVSPVVTVEGRYRSMVRFGETVRIEVKMEKYNGVKLEFSYRITDRESGELRFTGTSSHCFVDRAGKIVALKENSRKSTVCLRRKRTKKGKKSKFMRFLLLQRPLLCYHKRKKDWEEMRLCWGKNLTWC